MTLSFKQLFALLFITFAALLAATALQAWTGPTASAPGGNVPAPLNVGTSDQVKNAGLSVNAFAAFGDSYFAGNVGIGAPSPAQKLVVNGSSWLSGNLIVQNGNVGIGTANPAYALTVTSGNKAVSIGEGSGSDSDGRLILGWTSATGGTPAWSSISSYQSGYKELAIEAGPLVLNSNGNNVGIGTASPGATLDVAGNVHVSGNLDVGGSNCSHQMTLYVCSNGGAMGTSPNFCSYMGWGPTNTLVVCVP